MSGLKYVSLGAVCLGVALLGSCKPAKDQKEVRAAAAPTCDFVAADDFAHRLVCCNAKNSAARGCSGWQSRQDFVSAHGLYPIRAPRKDELRKLELNDGTPNPYLFLEGGPGEFYYGSDYGKVEARRTELLREQVFGRKAIRHPQQSRWWAEIKEGRFTGLYIIFREGGRVKALPTEFYIIGNGGGKNRDREAAAAIRQLRAASRKRAEAAGLVW